MALFGGASAPIWWRGSDEAYGAQTVVGWGGENVVGKCWWGLENIHMNIYIYIIYI
jgi:hypothetical protein